MIQGITSLGQGGRTRVAKLSVWAVHFGGSLLGGATMALFIWLIFTPIRTLLPAEFGKVGLAVAAVGFVLTDLQVIKRKAWRPQVRASWMKRFGPLRSYALYGLILGAGLPTFAPYAVTYVAFLASGLLASPIQALVLGGLFGFGRGLPVGPLSASRRVALALPSALRIAYGRFPVVSAAFILVIVTWALLVPS